MQKKLFIKRWEGLNIFPCPTYSELHATKKCNNSFDVQKYPKMLWLSSHIMFFSDVGNTDGWKQKKTFIVACDMACWIVSHPCSRLMSTTTIFFSIFPKTFLHLKRSAMIPWATIWRRWWPIAILGTENLQLWVKYIFGNNSSKMSTNQRILNCGWKKNIWEQEKFPGQQFKRVCVQ